MRHLLPVLALAAAVALAAAWAGFAATGPFTRYFVKGHRTDVRLRADGAELGQLRPRFGLACGFAAAAVIGAAVVSRPKPSAASLAARAVVFLTVAALAFVCATALCRYEFSAFVRQANEVVPVTRAPEVSLTDLPIVRIPVVAGVAALVAAGLMRAAGERLKRDAN